MGGKGELGAKESLSAPASFVCFRSLSSSLCVARTRGGPCARGDTPTHADTRSGGRAELHQALKHRGPKLGLTSKFII